MGLFFRTAASFFARWLGFVHFRSRIMVLKHKLLCSSLLVLLLCSGAPSADKPPPDKNAEAVAKALAALAKAYNARDPKAISQLFTPRGEFIDADSNVFDSREAIAGEFTALFEINPKNSGELSAEEIREISPGILSVDCVASFSAGNDADKEVDKEKPTVDVDFAMLLVKQADGTWLVASLRSEGETSIRTPHGRLKALEWLIGEWVDESDESTMHTKTRWSDDGHFILTDFTVQVAGRKAMSGTQRIGWDGSLDKFKSWVFDSEGGHAEGIWTEVDDRWVVKATGVRPDGDACSATHTYEQRGADSYVFTVTDRIIGDETAPDFTATVVRKPPEPQKATAAAAPRGK
jgi:uncharacterized protein (TIGR02246 family)